MMAERLERRRQEVSGCLMDIWEWVDEEVREFTDEGSALVHISPTPKAHIDDIAGIAGFADAMILAGWLRIRGSNGDTLEFPNLARHNGQSAKGRALMNERVQRSRNGGSVTHSSLLLSGPPWLGEVWKEWTEYKRERGDKKIVPSSEVRQLRKLLEWGEARSRAALDVSIRNNWQGMYEPKDHPPPAQDRPANLDAAMRLADEAARPRRKQA